jgi:hypothetical protein
VTGERGADQTLGGHIPQSHRFVAAAHAAKVTVVEDVNRIALRLWQYVKDEGVMTTGELRKKLKSRDRPYFQSALDHCLRSG